MQSGENFLVDIWKMLTFVVAKDATLHAFLIVRGVAQLAARHVRDVEVGSSSLLTPTKLLHTRLPPCRAATLYSVKQPLVAGKCKVLEVIVLISETFCLPLHSFSINTVVGKFSEFRLPLKTIPEGVQEFEYHLGKQFLSTWKALTYTMPTCR